MTRSLFVLVTTVIAAVLVYRWDGAEWLAIAVVCFGGGVALALWPRR